MTSRGTIGVAFGLLVAGWFVFFILIPLAQFGEQIEDDDAEPYPLYVVAHCDVAPRLDVAGLEMHPLVRTESTCDLSTSGALRWIFVDFADGNRSAGFMDELLTLANNRNYGPAEPQVRATRCGGQFVVGVVPKTSFPGDLDLGEIKVDCPTGS